MLTGLLVQSRAMGKNVIPANADEEADEGEDQTEFLELRAAG